MLSMFLKLEELRTTYVVRFFGVKVCKGKVMEPLATLKDLKVVSVKEDLRGQYATYPMTVFARAKQVARPGSEGSEA